MGSVGRRNWGLSDDYIDTVLCRQKVIVMDLLSIRQCHWFTESIVSRKSLLRSLSRTRSHLPPKVIFLALSHRHRQS